MPSVFESALFGTRLGDAFFQIHTGGDLAFLNGVLKHLIERDWLDRPFIEAHTSGFEREASDKPHWPVSDAMLTQPNVRRLHVRKVRSRQTTRARDALAVEEPLEIRVASNIGTHAITVTMRTPGKDFELAAGFCTPRACSAIGMRSAKCGSVISSLDDPDCRSSKPITRSPFTCAPAWRSTPNASGATSTPLHPAACAAKPRCRRWKFKVARRWRPARPSLRRR